MTSEPFKNFRRANQIARKKAERENRDEDTTTPTVWPKGTVGEGPRHTDGWTKDIGELPPGVSE